MALSDVTVRNAKPAEKQVKLFDGGGLFLLVAPKKLGPDGKPLPASKLWRLKYRFGGKEKLLALGTYPATSLADARDKRDAARKLLASGIDPGEARKAEKEARAEAAENTFEAVAREWHEKFKGQWSEKHAEQILRRLQLDVFPFIGVRPISEIKAPELLAVLRRVEKRTLETAHRLRIACGQVFRYAVATGRAERDPVSDLRGALPPVRSNHYAAPTDPKQVAPLLRAIDEYQGSFIVKCALRLAPLTFVRPGELRHAEWSEIDLDTATWEIPAKRMKMKIAHIVPLSTRAVAILRELHALTGQGRYVFPGHRSPLKPMSENAVNVALRLMGFDRGEITGHGFRAMARTILDEVLHVRPDFIEHQLAHAVKDPLGRAYNRTSHLAERRRMMELWAEYLEGLKAGAKVIPIKRVEGQ
ncbi:tyrosine-type recombinase/integrase [Geobacter sulfurreducens]|uniref:tyrosine-type recombinase/integrase n=1 Tax=Geobacter sulfurreducens TaxID=35554 RepID=UPI002C528C9E|nr:integrase arm-type DNA-binding domain-containing protein [Geobacter sulfurreducens]HML80030.1 integrase arm-type DNA-binding domain-containing protein [Geobacter sulfurreducens]